MKTKLSNSAVDKYNECSLCYKLHFIDRIRPRIKGSALVFGGAIDKGLNHLIVTKNVQESKDIFHNNLKDLSLNNTHYDKNDIPTSIKYSKSDLDLELLEHFKLPMLDANLESLLIKGDMFIEAYAKEVLPKIKRVIAIQEPITIKNEDGDEITGFLDLIVEWEDGKIYLLDNKTSTVKYEETSAKDGQQLPLYYYATKDKYKLDGIGYIVLSKKINKNKVKKCKSCGTLNESTHKKCPVSWDEPVMNGEDIKVVSKRCHGEFDITINPTVDIQYIFNQVEESDIDRVIETFDQVNYCISNGMFATEHNPERGKFGYCPYNEYTPENPDFYKLPDKK